MKSLSLVFLTLIAATALVRAQEDTATDASVATAVPITARILGEIPDGSPPPAAEPKPEYKVAKSDVLDTTTHEQGGRTITIQRINPIDLPPPPPPAAVVAAEPDAEFSERVAEYQKSHPENELLFLGATVFRSKDSPPRTLVRWWPMGGKGTITFWSSADFSLIAGGITSFQDNAGDTHAMLMGWGNVDLDRMSDIDAAAGREYDAPDLPDFPEGKATFEVTGDTQPTAEDMAIIESLHDLYNSEHDRLQTAYEGREQARIEREAYLKAHPPQPKDITLNYWRVERSASNENGEGAR